MTKRGPTLQFGVGRASLFRRFTDTNGSVKIWKTRNTKYSRIYGYFYSVGRMVSPSTDHDTTSGLRAVRSRPCSGSRSDLDIRWHTAAHNRRCCPNNRRLLYVSHQTHNTSKAGIPWRRHRHRHRLRLARHVYTSLRPIRAIYSQGSSPGNSVCRS